MKLCKYYVQYSFIATVQLKYYTVKVPQIIFKMLTISIKYNTFKTIFLVAALSAIAFLALHTIFFNT